MNIYVYSTKNVISGLWSGLQNKSIILQKNQLSLLGFVPGHSIFLNSQHGTEKTCMCSFAASIQSKKKLVQSGTAVCVSLRSAPCHSEHATVKMLIILSLSSAGPLH